MAKPTGNPNGRPRQPAKLRGGERKRLAHLIEKTGLTPLAYMLEGMRDPKAPKARRDDLAKAAAPYVHARLASTVVQGDASGGPIRIKIEGKVAGVL